MTKKQNRSRGFGKRSLSVVLTVLIVLSSLVVMLSATTLSANAAISYWFVSGDFNGWTHSADLGNKINGSSGSVTVNITGATFSSIEFKMVAYENGNENWCTAEQTLQSDQEYEMSWNKANSANMKYLLKSDTTQVTFTIVVRNNKNYVKVSQNGTGGGGGGDTGQMTFDAPVNTNNSANTATNLFWATATYYDYMSDEELSNTQWLKPVQAGTHNFNGAVDEWYPFYRFNREVVKAQADAQSNWSQPLYFGNFCDTNNAYDSPHHQNGTDSYGYREATNSYNVTRFVHIANNSDYNQSGSAHLANMNCSYQGLMNNQLSSSGDLLLPNGQTAPYFNASSLEGRAKVVNSSFPFKVTTYTDKKYKKYTFNSKNATDNVYFTWATDGSLTYPTGVNYGAGTTYGVLDGVSRFMSGGTSGYGIFPFNNASNNYKGTKTNANENLNYGFGIKTQVKFRVPAPDAAHGVNTSSDPIYFRFSGDDDLWMYITDDSTGESQLVLDMGGDHKESTGYVNFNTLQAKVDKVGTGGGAVTKNFTFDYSKTYTMTVFYMERGLIESNCEMEFTMTPLGNNFIVTEEIDTTNVNPGIADVVKQLSTFGFNPLESDEEISDETYKDFELGDGGRVSIGDDALPINSDVKIRQYAPSNTYLTYSSSWKYYDNVGTNGKTLLGEGTGVTSNGVTTTTDEHTLINESGNEYDYAELQVDYRNTPQVDSFAVTKYMAAGAAVSSDKTFPATIYLQFKSDEQPAAYTLYDDDSNVYTNGRINFKANETITFTGVPVGTRVFVVEDYDENYTPSYNYTRTSPAVVGDGADIIVTNTPNESTPTTAVISGTKLLDGKPFTGDMFQFYLDGVPRSAGDSADIKDTSDYLDETVTATNGSFSFTEIPFTAPGIYRYHVYENPGRLSQKDLENMGRSHFSTDFAFAGDFLVQITVSDVNFELVASDPVYIPFAGGTPTSADFDLTKQVASMTFTNTMQKGSVKVVKENQTGASVDDVIFVVYKVDATIKGILDDTSKTEEQKYNEILAYNGKVEAGAGSTGNPPADDPTAEGVSGEARINNLPIYEDGFVTTTTTGGVEGLSASISSVPTYQKYVLMELDPAQTAGPNGYIVNKSVNVFSFPIEGQYDFIFEYVNNQLKAPNTAGSGMMTLKLIGMIVAAISVLSLGGYMLYTKRFVKKKAGRHFAD